MQVTFDRNNNIMKIISLRRAFRHQASIAGSISRLKQSFLRIKIFCKKLFFLGLLTGTTLSFAQNPGTGSNFAVDGDLYSGVRTFPPPLIEDATDDWFQSAAGLGVIEEVNTASIATLLQAGGNPTFEARMSQLQNSVVDGQIWIDAVYARDHFGAPVSPIRHHLPRPAKTGRIRPAGMWDLQTCWARTTSLMWPGTCVAMAPLWKKGIFGFLVSS